MTEILRYAAFTSSPRAGNPAGVVLDATGLGEDRMLAIAAEVGYSETAFLTPAGPRAYQARYFSPEIEVPFCGHATVATAVALAERDGPGELTFHTQAGEIRIQTTVDGDRQASAVLTSVPTRSEPAADADVDAALAALGWARADLDAALPPRVAYAGALHLVLAVRTRARLAALDYDFAALRDLMVARGWVTLQLAWRESPAVYRVRNPFPPGGIVEDPATGAAAAAFGGYLRDLGLAAPGAELTLHQGEDMGRPSLLRVGVRPDGRVDVAGQAVAISQ
ncbi:PhzF family phenazine biosynthesis protein [Longispora albida]|uniref:PhzF family phenazine biosynthesis protein n=1 Tax=Longispora albida TaxID=203523 RepID=UPI00039D9F4A|nr:PhzF family phenazine biosynthesis isomerase [Longispora albida]